MHIFLSLLLAGLKGISEYVFNLIARDLALNQAWRFFPRYENSTLSNVKASQNFTVRQHLGALRSGAY